MDLFDLRLSLAPDPKYECETIRPAPPSVPRYRLSHGKLREHPQGEWVRFEDLAATQPAKTTD